MVVRGKHRRRLAGSVALPASWRRIAALLLVVALAAVGLSFAPSVLAAANPTFSITTNYDGTGQGTATACPITGTGGDNTATDGVVCTATYTVTQADLDNGTIDDTGTVTGTPPSGNPPTSHSTVTVPVQAKGGLTIVKSAKQSVVHHAGDRIDYTFHVTNGGNLTLHDVAVADTQLAPAGHLNAAPHCGATVLAPGQSTDCSASYTVSAADIQHGAIDDVAVATAKTPAGDPVTSPQARLRVPVAQTTTTGLARTGARVAAGIGAALALLGLGAVLLVAGTWRRRA